MARQRQQNEYAGNIMFKVAKMGMILSGLSPPMKQWSKQKQSIYKWYSEILHFNLSISVIQCVILLFKEIILEQNVAKALGHMHYSIAIVLIYTTGRYCKRKDSLALFETSIEWANRNSKEYITAANFEMKYCKVLSVTIITFSVVAVVCYIFTNILLVKITASQEFQWTFWYGFDAGKYEIYIFWLELVRMTIIGLYNVPTQTVLLAFVIDCVAKCKVLQHKFTNFNIGEKEGTSLSHCKANNCLKTLVKEHQQVTAYIAKLNEIFKNLLYVEYKTSSLMIACFLVNISKGQNILFNTVVGCLFIAQLLLLCYTANEINVQTSRISEALYNSLWYQYGKEIGVTTQMVMIRSSRPSYLTIGPFGPLTAKSGLEVLKVAYSFISIVSGSNLVE